MQEYEISVGLEVHAELCTKSKIYCSCRNEFGAEVNTNCCPNCTGMPGTLPTLNEAVVDFAVRAGLAMNCEIRRLSKQDRKNYFYSDLPKGYQTTQFDLPLCHDGYLDMIAGEDGSTKRVGITRVHIEEDTAKLIHDDSFDGELIDFNRCGVPLIEIVTEPDIRSAADARSFLETLKSVLVCIGVCDGKMQEGSIRCDVNVSVRPVGSPKLGTRCEMKNVSTFSGAQRAIEYEAARQIETLRSGGEIHQETRRWDDLAGVNYVMRSKEDAQDYRYFPEPDLLAIAVDEERIRAIRDSLPELPQVKTLRLMREYSLPLFDANLLVETPAKAAFFESAARSGSCQPKNLSNWILGDVSRLLGERGAALEHTKLTPEKLSEMVRLIESGEISGAAGKIVIEEIMFSDKTAAETVREKNLAQISDHGALEKIARSVLESNGAAVEQYKNGKTNVIGFLVGQCMKLSGGQGNPSALREIILSLISAE